MERDGRELRAFPECLSGDILRSFGDLDLPQRIVQRTAQVAQTAVAERAVFGQADVTHRNHRVLIGNIRGDRQGSDVVLRVPRHIFEGGEAVRAITLLGGIDAVDVGIAVCGGRLQSGSERCELALLGRGGQRKRRRDQNQTEKERQESFHKKTSFVADVFSILLYYIILCLLRSTRFDRKSLPCVKRFPGIRALHSIQRGSEA